MSILAKDRISSAAVDTKPALQNLRVIPSYPTLVTDISRLSSPLRLTLIGHVDHGKSTLIGRLLYETGALLQGQFEAVQAMANKRAIPLEWSFLLDSFQAERNQAVTIDTTQIRFSSLQRDYLIVDVPGHVEFLKNMITGTADSDAALLVIAANEGIQAQTRRHGHLLRFLGIKQLVCAVNKMDLVAFDPNSFHKIADEISTYLTGLGVIPTAIIPISARDGDNLVVSTAKMDWYDGPSLIEALDAFVPPPSLINHPLRFSVQDVYHFDSRRTIVGRIESGQLSVGDRLLFSPGQEQARIVSLAAWSVPEIPQTAQAGDSIGLILDKPIFVRRGDLASHPETPPVLTNVFRLKLFWFSPTPLKVGNHYDLRILNQKLSVEVDSIEHVFDPSDTSDPLLRSAHQVAQNEVAELVLRTTNRIALDQHQDIAPTGRCVLMDAHRIGGGGLIHMEGYPNQRSLHDQRSTNITFTDHRVCAPARRTRNGHSGGVLWLTGYSGSGKSTLAMALEQALFQRDQQVYVLDGDNIRHGLNSDLTFSPEDRSENIRRLGEVAALFADAGLIVIAAFISPYRADRARARAACPYGFHEIHIQAPMKVCEQRDPKGLYRRARSGEIPDFTGVSAPYEPPTRPDFVVDTVSFSVSECLEQLLDYAQSAFRYNKI